MGIVFQSGIGKASPIARQGYWIGMICDEPYCIFRHLNLNAFQRRYHLRVLLWVRAYLSYRYSKDNSKNAI